MRTNTPVTQTEYILPEGIAIISRTDEKGRIVDCNEQFVIASGYSRDELIGKPHNIVRHPDMPQEGFRDLWATLKRGRPWSGLVKNRRKNGDYYWVLANATPEPQGGGYMSVRIAPDRASVQAAEALYARMRQDPKLCLREGQLVVKGGLGSGLAALFRRLAAPFRRSVGLRVLAAGLFPLLVLAAMALYAAFGIGQGGVDGQGHAQFVQVMAAAVGLATVATFALAFWAGRSITGPLKAAGQAADDLARGNLLCTMPLPGEDEVGALVVKLTVMRNMLHELIAGIRQEAEGVERSATALTTTATQATASAEHQSGAACTMAATIEELSVSIDHINEHASHARQLSDDASDRARQGGNLILDVSKEMATVADAVRLTAGTVEELERFSGQISSIVSAIKEIADQTNLLALNAAIEAARAGESGRGFAVVADEVRKLAERTGKSTVEIGSMIQQIQTCTRNAASEMQAGVGKVHQGVDLAQAAGESVGGIEQGAHTVLEAVDGITLGLNEQSSAAREIAQQVEGIARHAEANAAAAVSIQHTALEMAQLSRSLTSLTGRFRIA